MRTIEVVGPVDAFSIRAGTKDLVVVPLGIILLTRHVEEQVSREGQELLAQKPEHSINRCVAKYLVVVNAIVSVRF